MDKQTNKLMDISDCRVTSGTKNIQILPGPLNHLVYDSVSYCFYCFCCLSSLSEGWSRPSSTTDVCHRSDQHSVRNISGWKRKNISASSFSCQCIKGIYYEHPYTTYTHFRSYIKKIMALKTSSLLLETLIYHFYFSLFLIVYSLLLECVFSSSPSREYFGNTRNETLIRTEIHIKYKNFS